MTIPRRTALVVTALLLWPVGSVLAHGAGLANAPDRSLDVPTWLFLLTGGGVIGASFLLASFVTDRAFIRQIHSAYRRSVIPAERLLRLLGRGIGLLGLGFILVVCFFGPRDPLFNAGVLLVWAGWWSGYVMTTYLVGNSWPVINPFRTLAEVLPTLDRPYPDRLGAWPSVAGLLALIWFEVVSPVADQPRFLGSAIAGYTVLTLLGAAVFGSEQWFESADPVSRVFAYFGRVAPVYRAPGENGRLRFRLPGTGLDEPRLVDSWSEVGFVVAILWATTYDGLVATPLWRQTAVSIVEAGVPPNLLYAVSLLVGYGFFLGIYRLAATYSKRFARTYVPTETLAYRFAPPLLAIAAGYHVAHFLGYFLELLPALLGTLAAPLDPPAPVALVLPGWFGGVDIAFVILGHLLAIWAAHAAAYDVFPGKLQAVRSQYSITLVMVFYTIFSLWIVTQPYAVPPYVS
ncbi:MAG: hypothetical protein PPP58_03295 [Natronomonas sp.]